MTNNGANSIDAIRLFIIGLPRAVKKSTAVIVDFIGFSLCACGTVWLLFQSAVVFPVLVSCAAVAVFSVLLAWSLGLYRSVVRYMGLDLFIAAAKSAVGGAIFGAALMFYTGMATSPTRWAIVYCGMAFVYVCSSRYLARLALIKRRARIERDRVIIYGAGAAGAQLAIDLQSGDEFIPVAVVDDDRGLHGTTLKGLAVYAPDSIGELIADTNASRVLLAIPNTSRLERRTVLEHLAGYNVHVQTIPRLHDIVSGKSSVDDIRDVEVKDILGRDQVPPHDELLSASIAGKNVLVTGAGGSIGSELCRQIIQLNPESLVLFELSEFALYSIEIELRSIMKEIGSQCAVVALLGSVHHKDRVQEVMATFKIETIYHAAAYKHVPLVEHNILEGIHNNVIGTLHLAEAAIAAKVSTFVLISTDKAVSPTNIMGATKRFSELILQALQGDCGDTRFGMVRFGNVLESSGSVVPRFREQIRSGGPVTVTHRDIIRYFMTIPEAAQLVIQAASMTRGGDVFVLDMGEPVRILDLALRMVNLMGLTVKDDDHPGGDIEIEFTGLRPAEKLYEELLIGSDVSGTDHPRILRADEEMTSLPELRKLIDELKSALSNLDRKTAREVLLRAVAGYGPTNGIDDLVWSRQMMSSNSDDKSTVVDFPNLSA